MRKLDVKYNVLQYAKWLLLFMYVLSILGITSVISETGELLAQKQTDYEQLEEAYKELKTKYEPDSVNESDFIPTEKEIGLQDSDLKARERHEKVITYFWAILLGITAIYIFLFSYIEKKMNKILIKFKDDENLEML